MAERDCQYRKTLTLAKLIVPCRWHDIDLAVRPFRILDKVGHVLFKSKVHGALP